MRGWARTEQCLFFLKKKKKKEKKAVGGDRDLVIDIDFDAILPTEDCTKSPAHAKICVKTSDKTLPGGFGCAA